MDLYSQEIQQKKKDLQNQPPKIRKWQYINNYFKYKWIKYSSQKTDWLNGYKNKTHIYAVYKKPTSDLKTHKLKVRGWKNIFHENGKQKKARVAILISDKIDLKIRNITRDKEEH